MRNFSIVNPWAVMRRSLLDDEDMNLSEWGVDDIQMDVYEEGDNVIVKVKAPGFSKEEVDVSLEKDTITVVGKSSDVNEEDDKKRKYYRKEIVKKSFTRSCALPVDVVPENSKANFQDGVLVITLPKSEESKPKKIKVELD
ncbi:Hsp20/alpha crystallin family protein [Candidatus Dojkabacteria bacterium]|nr:Hsp20/alpha crystallin family protein [Candidatus Dojkabacteria bacterium]